MEHTTLNHWPSHFGLEVRMKNGDDSSQHLLWSHVSPAIESVQSGNGLTSEGMQVIIKEIGEARRREWKKIEWIRSAREKSFLY